MAGFRKDKTTAAQTAANVAGAVTVARIASGEFAAGEDINTALVGTFQALYGELAPVVDGDNALFAEVEAAAPSTAKATKKAETVVDPAAPGDTVFTGGKFKGQSIKDVYEMSEDAAKSFGHQYGAGSSYVTNYVATDKNSNEATRQAAQAYIASLSKAA